MAVPNSTHELHSTLLVLHAKFSKRQATEENEYLITELRNGINDVKQIIDVFKDFIGNRPPAGENTVHP